MGYPMIRPKQGKDFNFFEKQQITWTNFGGGAPDGYGPDMIIPFTTNGIFFLNEQIEDGRAVEYSFNGRTVHGELVTNFPTQGLVFDNRVISLIWFRLKAGSTGPVNVSVQAWSIQ